MEHRFRSFCTIFPEKQDLPGIARPVSWSPAMISLPSCDPSHIPGGLDPVASPAEDLEIIPGPLITSHGDRPDMIQDIVMTLIRLFGGTGLVNLLPAQGTLPSLLVPDTSPHQGDRSSHFEPVLHTAGGLAADRMLISRIEVESLAATLGTGTPGDPLLLLRSILAIFPDVFRSHLPCPPLIVIMHIFPGPHNTGQEGVKVMVTMVSHLLIQERRQTGPDHP